MLGGSDARTWKTGSQLIVMIAVILVIMLAVGLIIFHRTARSANTAVNLSSLYWIYYKEDLNRLRALDPAIIDATLSGPGTYVLEQSGGGSRLPGGAIPTQLFFGSAAVTTAARPGTIIPGVRNVAYDPENWPVTPVAEQQNPMAAMKTFAESARGQGMQPMLLPGRDLMQVPGGRCTKKQGETLTDAYLRCGVPAAAAYAPIYVIQSAPVELDLTQVGNLVRQAAAQARAVNPDVIIIATLNMTPGGKPVSDTAVCQAARKILPYVQGFLINSTRSTDSRMISFLRALQGGS